MGSNALLGERGGRCGGMSSRAIPRGSQLPAACGCVAVGHLPPCAGLRFLVPLAGDERGGQ